MNQLQVNVPSFLSSREFLAFISSVINSNELFVFAYGVCASLPDIFGKRAVLQIYLGSVNLFKFQLGI